MCRTVSKAGASLLIKLPHLCYSQQKTASCSRCHLKVKYTHTPGLGHMEGGNCGRRKNTCSGVGVETVPREDSCRPIRTAVRSSQDWEEEGEPEDLNCWVLHIYAFFEGQQNGEKIFKQIDNHIRFTPLFPLAILWKFNCEQKFPILPT